MKDIGPSETSESFNNKSLVQNCNEGVCVQLFGTNTDTSDDDEEFVYPEISADIILASHSRQSPSPAQLESLYAAASSGDLPFLKRLFITALESGEVEPFTLANHASIRSGFTVLHVAASRGHHDLVVWLIAECGAMPDLEDREGETALHKAAFNGHMSILQFLLPDKSDVNARDADGWTALHNACSKGYLDIVRWMCEKSGAAAIIDGVRGVDVHSKDGWTPLMNAASKGHLPVVLYLLTKQAANPVIRNKWGETAFDVAAAVFEIWICEILQQAEAERWRGAQTPYNPFLVHTTIPLVIYENQRLDTRLKTVAISGGSPKFSPAGLGKQGRRAPFELKHPMPTEGNRTEFLPAWRSGIQLPLKSAPWVLPLPVTPSQAALESVERSHFWLSDWTLDVTHPAVDALEGWQYAPSFDEPEDKWTSEMHPQLERLVTSNIIIPAGIGSSTLSNPLLSSPHPKSSQPMWVRRRRWVRIMRRRLDIAPLPFLEPDGALYYLKSDGSLIPYESNSSDTPDMDDGQELIAVLSNPLSPVRDYVARARYLVDNGTHDVDASGSSLSAIETRRVVGKLVRAISELKQGILRDDDADRKIQAEVLLNAYGRQLERCRLSAGVEGLLISTSEACHDHDGGDDDDDDDSEEFFYPQTPISEARTSSRTSASDDYSNRPLTTSILADLTPQLTQSPEFRVPTRETPQKMLASQWTPIPRQLHAEWERDDAVYQCRDCNRRFNFLIRRHCRKCGRIFCDRCSSYRTLLDPVEVIRGPLSSEVLLPTTVFRVCQSCYEEVANNIPSRLHRTGAMERIVVDQERLTIPGSLTRRQSSSQLSDLADCPVCNQNLDEVGDAASQEAHVKSCLEGSSEMPQAGKYLVYRLPAESALIGVECVICLEEFVKGSTVARLSCFCSFHNVCLGSWLQRGKSCPVHAR